MLNALLVQPLLFSQYTFLLLMCSFFVQQEEIVTSGSWGNLNLQSSCDQLLAPGIWWEKVSSMTKETQRSPLAFWNSLSPSFPLRTLLLGPELREGLWTVGHSLPRLLAPWIKQSFLSSQHLFLQYQLLPNLRFFVFVVVVVLVTAEN